MPNAYRRTRVAQGLMAAAVLGALASASQADAQRTFELTPFAGTYIPISSLGDEGGTEAKHQPSVALGIRGTFPGAGRVGLEGVIGLAAGAVKATSASQEAEVSGRIVMASVRALWALGTPGESRSWHATTGVGVSSRGSDAYSPFDGTTDIGGIIGIGMRTRVGRWALRFDLEDNISSVKLADDAEAALQNDLMLSVGLVIPLGNR